MRRLAVQVYLTVVGVLLIFALLVTVAWLVHPMSPWEREFAERLAATVAEVLPAPDRPPEELQASVDRLASRLRVGVAVYAPDGGLLALVAEEGARSGAEVGGDPEAVVRGDARLLRRLVRNLLENARRHGGEGPVEAWVERRGAGARIRVLDRGPGVPEDERERIFEPFHRPTGRSETGAGHGLGLALVLQIARAHGGEARCRPREGGGTAFEVELGA
jgi:two-component system, OmpR family, sensor histidine kinase RstB